MAMIGYVARVLTGVRFKKMNHMIDVVHQKCGQNNVRTFFDMLWCAVRYGAGYYDYTMFGFYNMTGAQRDGGMLLAPRDTTTRAQAATLIMRFQSAFAKEP